MISLPNHSKYLLLVLSTLSFALSTEIDEVYEPTSNWNGTRGLTQVISAESMGAGRLTLHGHGTLYQQDRNFAGTTASKGTNVSTGMGAVSFGLSPYIDGFITGGIFNMNGGNYNVSAGTTSFSGGLQGSIPFPETVPARLGIQVAAITGTAEEQINTNGADGYNYFEMRTATDFVARLTQSLLFNGDGVYLKLHLNEGMVSSLEKGKSMVLLQAAAIEFSPHPTVVTGVEISSRTFFKNSQNTDPFWITPSLTVRTPFHLNAQIGADISLSADRPLPTLDRALEPWRAFGSLTLSFDLLAGKRREARDRAARDSIERAKLEEQARLAQKMLEDMARKAKQDSINAEEANRLGRLRADSLAAKSHQDSLVLASKAHQDSLALAEANRRLEEERNKRPDWEREFLRTGVLNLEALYFETAKAQISINSKPYLNLVGRMLSKYPKLDMEIAGHTDNTGKPAKNLTLSEDRANEVRVYLTSAYPTLNGHLTAHGYGATVPKESNTTSQGRQINRRVEIKVLNKDVLKEYAP